MIRHTKLKMSKCTRLVQRYFKVQDKKTHVHKLKQAPRAWYGRINSFPMSLVVTKSKVDPNIYFQLYCCYIYG